MSGSISASGVVEGQMTDRNMLALAAELGAEFVQLPGVRAVALGGSLSTGASDLGSDIDIYVYTDDLISLEARAAMIRPRASQAEIGNEFWEPGDEWIEHRSGAAVDVMYRSPAWIEGELSRVLDHHQASLGYSTCFWHNVLTCTVMEDRTGWLSELKRSADRPYPEELARRIIGKNHPLLRGAMGAYSGQLTKAANRRDTVALNHRAAALLASYFDVLFALNRRPHPGEKRLIELAGALEDVPERMAEDVATFLDAVAAGDPRIAVSGLLNRLDERLAARNELPPPHGQLFRA